MYTNECGWVANNGTLGGCYEEECRPEWAWHTVPPSLDWIGVDAYDEANIGGATEDEGALAKRWYEDIVFPRLLPHQRVVLVPGVFANSPEGCASKGVACPLAVQAEVVVPKLRGYAQCAAQEPRIVALNPWHVNNRLAPQFPLPYDQRLGAVAMPVVLDELRAIGRNLVTP